MEVDGRKPFVVEIQGEPLSRVDLRYGHFFSTCFIWMTCTVKVTASLTGRVAVISAKNHKRQRRKRQSVTAKREKSQTLKVLTAVLTLPNLT